MTTVVYHDRYVPTQEYTAKIEWLENELDKQIDINVKLRADLSKAYKMLGATRTEVRTAKSDFAALAEENERKRQALSHLLKRGL